MAPSFAAATAAPEDWRLALLLVVLASFLAVGTLAQYRRALLVTGKKRAIYIALATINGTCGGWVAAIAGLLAAGQFQSSGPSEWWLSLVWVVVTVVLGAGLLVAAEWEELLLAGGALMGAAMTGAHQLAFRSIGSSAGPAGWTDLLPDFVVASLCCIAALWLVRHRQTLRWFSVSAALFLLAFGAEGFLATQISATAAAASSQETVGFLGLLAMAGGAATLFGSFSVFGNVDKDREYERLTDALDNLHVGVLVFDADERILLCNRPYRRLYDVPENVVRPGTGTLTSLLAYRTSNGTFRENPDQYLVNLRSALRTESSTHREPTLADGRVVSVSTHPMAGGGWVAIHENISAIRQVEQERAELQERERRRLWIENAIALFRQRSEAILRSVTDRTDTMTRIANALLSTSSQMTDTAQSALSTSEGASTNIDTAARAATELSHSIEEIDRQLVQTNSTVQSAASTAGRAEQDGKALAGAAERIGNIVDIIQNIATQTNLLSLNATIEAARAGNAGRGFSVVASEVRELSQQTAVATKEIADQIGAVQRTSGSVVDAIRQITKAMQEVASYSLETGSAVSQQHEATEEISRSFDGAATISKVAASVLAKVLADSRTGAASADQVLKASRAVEESTENMRNEIKEFLSKVSEQAKADLQAVSVG